MIKLPPFWALIKDNIHDGQEIRVEKKNFTRNEGDVIIESRYRCIHDFIIIQSLISTNLGRMKTRFLSFRKNMWNYQWTLSIGVQIGRNSKSHSGLHSHLVGMHSETIEHSYSQSLIFSSQGYISLLSSMISTRTCP